MRIVIDISKDRYDEIMSMDWKNCRRFFDEEIRAIHDGKALEKEPETDGWHDSEKPPKNDKYVLLSFSNYPVPCVGRYYGTEEEGGNYYEGDEEKPLIQYGLIVSGWMELPKCRRD